MVRKTTLTFAAAAFAVLAAMPMEAQNYRFDLGINGGGSWYSPSLDEDHIAAGEEAAFEAGWLLGAQGTFWLTPRFGLRANGTWTDRPFQLGDNTGEIATEEDTDFELINDVNLWSATGDLMIRFTEATSRFSPFLALGVGVKSIHPALETVQVGTVEGDSEIKGPIFTANNQRFLMDHSRQLMGLAGIGGDVRLADNFALRLEVGDRIWDSPIFALNADNTLVEGEEDTGNAVHEVYGQLGLHMLFGVETAEEVVVAPAPPPPPAAPAPEVVEETVSVCVIDPATGTAGIRTIQATYLVETRDTVVMVNGRRVAIAETVDVPLVGDAEWFVSGQPLVLETDRDRVEFVTFGTSRIIESDLTLIGTVDGLPVYAAETDVDLLSEHLAEMRAAEDLQLWLAENRGLEDEFRELGVVYVPLQPVGCVFQPLQQVEPVRKGGKE